MNVIKNKKVGEAEGERAEKQRETPESRERYWRRFTRGEPLSMTA